MIEEMIGKMTNTEMSLTHELCRTFSKHASSREDSFDGWRMME